MGGSGSFVDAGGFAILAEVEPATKPDLRNVREQIAVLAPVSNAFLIPDNHLGRATVSSLAVAHEVAAMGRRAVACLNARDRNLLGLRRDLLTAAAYGVDHLLLVQGDQAGADAAGLTTRTMFEEARESAAALGMPGLKLGVTTRVGSAVPAWKREADFILTQVSFSVRELHLWRETLAVDCPVLAGVIVLPSATMARKLAGGGYDITIPEALVERLEADPNAGLQGAMNMVDGLRAAPGIEGVHLVSGRRYRQVAMELLVRATSG